MLKRQKLNDLKPQILPTQDVVDYLFGLERVIEVRTRLYTQSFYVKHYYNKCIKYINILFQNEYINITCVHEYLTKRNTYRNFFVVYTKTT